MKICEEKIPPLMVFQELFNENVLFARGINWLYPDKTEEQRLMGFANISSELLMCPTAASKQPMTRSCIPSPRCLLL